MSLLEIAELERELEDVSAERDRYEAALRDIESRDWVENALDPQWAAMRAKEALDKASS